MNRTVATLSLTTAVFAASTLYLGYKLYGGSSGSMAATTSSGPAGPPASDIAAAPDKGPAATSAPGAASVTGPSATSAAATATPPPAGKAAAGAKTSDEQRATMLPFAKQYLAKLDDPGRRAALVEETRSGLRRQYEPLKQKLKLDSATFEQLLTILAEQQIQPQEKYFRCIADPACDLNNFGRNGNVVDDRSGELLSLLGNDDAEELKNYTSSLHERETVVQLRGRLDEASNLRDSQAEQLVAALSEERIRFQKDAAQRGTSVSGWGTPQLGMLYYSGDSNSLDQRFTEAAQYSQRLRDRAATVLSPKQLAAFAQIQEELLATMRATMLPPG